MVERAITRGGGPVAALDADALINRYHARIGGMSLPELRDAYLTAAALDVRAWEIQGHALSQALSHASYGANAYARLAQDWGVSRSRVYQLANAWAVRAPYAPDAPEVLALPESGWWSAAAVAAGRTDRTAREWIEEAFVGVTGPRQPGAGRYTLQHLMNEVQRHRQILAFGSVERDEAISAALRARIRSRLRDQIGSLTIYGERGPGGMSSYPGNHNPFVQLDLWIFYGVPERVLDPMEGSGTTRDLCRMLDIAYAGYDLAQGFDSLREPIPGLYDFVWWHPPYWGVMPYGEGAMSRAASYEAFLAELRAGFEKFWTQNVAPGGLLAVMMGDFRDGDRYYPLCAQTALLGERFLEAVVVTSHGEFESARAGTAADAERRHLPLVHEEIALFRMPGGPPRPPVPPPLLPDRVWRAKKGKKALPPPVTRPALPEEY